MFSRCIPKARVAACRDRASIFSSSCLFTVNVKLQSQRKRKRDAPVFASEEKKKANTGFGLCDFDSKKLLYINHIYLCYKYMILSAKYHTVF